MSTTIQKGDRKSRKSPITHLTQAYFRVQQPLTYGILCLVGLFSAFGAMQLALPALAGLGFMVLQVLFAIESRQSALSDAEKFTDFQVASLYMADSIREALSKNNRITLKWVGTTMDRGGPFLINQINQLLRSNPNVKVELEIFMLSPDCPKLSLFNTKWPSQTKNNYQMLNDWLLSCNPQKLEGAIYKYESPPAYTGLLIDDQVLFMAFSSWEENIAGINSTGNQSSYEYCVGMNPYYKHVSYTYEGSEHIRQYLIWIQHFKRVYN